MNAMKQCLRCGNVCIETSIFCENCQLSLLDRSEQKSFQTVPMPCPEINFLPKTKMIQDDDIDSRPLAMRPLPYMRRRAELRRRRRIFIALALFVIMALIIDGVLVTLVFTHSSHKISRGDAFPLLTLTPDVTYLGQVVQLHLSHFTPLSYVFLSHDVHETLRVDAPSPQIKIGASGNVTVRVLIAGKWGVGNHLITAEDTHTHYTASVALQVLGSRPVLPPQLQLNTSFLGMGYERKSKHIYVR